MAEPERHREAFAQIEKAGVTWVVVSTPARSAESTIELLEGFGSIYLARTRGGCVHWFSVRGGFDGTVALITGGAGDLGRAITLNFVEKGARTAVIDLDRDAAELAPDGIRVNNVAPDYTPTPGFTGVAASDLASAPAGVRVRIPIGRVGPPPTCRGVWSSLVSGLSGYVTGTTFHPDRGIYASGGSTGPDSGRDHAATGPRAGRPPDS